MMDNDQKAERYNQLLRMHDKLEERIADIKSDNAGMDLNDQQTAKVREYEQQKLQVIEETRQLFN
jgi:hypothetical protein|tara:strand:+ start:1453 stop:1647 length:195 start_codon:yes stop_codon:yes gene_type:complete